MLFLNRRFGTTTLILTLVMSVFSITTFTSRASAKLLSEPAYFARCYAQITGHPVPLGHAAMAQIRAGSLKALDACNALLDKAALDAAGNLADATDAESVNTLNHFYEFHRTLFPVNSQEQLPHYSQEYATGSGDVYDITEPALAMTKIIFGRLPYRDLLTSIGGVRAIRRYNVDEGKVSGWNIGAPSRRIFGDNPNMQANIVNFRTAIDAFDFLGTYSMLTPIPGMVQIGDLIGIRATTETFAVQNFAVQPFAVFRGDQQLGIILPFDLFATNGGGVMGYPSYLLSYFGHPDGVLPNGSLKLPRRWAVQSLKTFLCANMPDLRAGDVAQYLVPGSSAPFRAGNSCLGCHATQDQMAYTARNFEVAFGDFSGLTTGGAKSIHLLPKFAATLPSSGEWASEPVTNFHLQQPTGRFYFRSSTGTLYNTPVNDITGLGQAMTATDDYYECAAKHYFEMLTGIPVPYFDRGNASNEAVLKSLTQDQIDSRVYIEGLGAQLKKDQSILALVKTIISSTYFRSESYRP